MRHFRQDRVLVNRRNLRNGPVHHWTFNCRSLNMSPLIRTALLVCLSILSACAPSSYGPRVQGIWNPQVGSGAVYQVSSPKGEPIQLEYAVVGKEGTRYWIESKVAETRSKVLLDPSTGSVERMYMQTPGNPAVDMTQLAKFSQALVSTKGQLADTTIEQTGAVIGKESISTPAGTFMTTHYRSAQRNTSADVWIAQDVRPYGLVKMTTTKGETVELVRVLKNVSSQVSTPQ
jgi:hypothetical protein